MEITSPRPLQRSLALSLSLFARVARSIPTIQTANDTQVCIKDRIRFDHRLQSPRLEEGESRDARAPVRIDSLTATRKKGKSTRSPLARLFDPDSTKIPSIVSLVGE